MIFREIAFCHADRFRGDPFAFQILDAVNIGIFRHGKDPAQRIASDFSINEFRNFHNIRIVFTDPVISGQSAVENAFFDIAGHFLSTDQHAFDFRIIDRREIGPRTDLYFISGFGKHIRGCLFETPFRQAQHQFL